MKIFKKNLLLIPLTFSSLALISINAYSSCTISLTSPASGATFTAPANITIVASASSPDGTITQVEFFDGGNLIARDISSPYLATLSNVQPGTYTLTAVGQDNSGNTCTTPGRDITVNSATAETYSCVGFEPPFQEDITIKSKVQRSIPLKAQLFDSSGNIVSDSTLADLQASPPVVNVTYSNQQSDGDEVSNQDLMTTSTVGNSFKYDPVAQRWYFNLSTRNELYSAAGSYTVTMVSGSANYIISPCTGTFIRK